MYTEKSNPVGLGTDDTLFNKVILVVVQSIITLNDLFNGMCIQCTTFYKKTCFRSKSENKLKGVGHFPEITSTSKMSYLTFESESVMIVHIESFWYRPCIEILFCRYTMSR